MNRKILITGGGSGGHTMPAVSIYEQLKDFGEQHNISFDFLYTGSENGIEKSVASQYGISYTSISTGKLRRYLSLKNISDMFRVLKGIADSFRVVRMFKPDLVFSTGGFVSVPVVIAAKLSGVPIVIHEQTVDAGLANKIASRFADTIALTFEESRNYFPAQKTIVTGIPLRKALFTSNAAAARSNLGFDNALPVLYVTGGGLGCHTLNVTVLELLPRLLQQYNVILQTGNALQGKDYADALTYHESLTGTELHSRLKVFNFITSEIADIYCIADLAVARSGAGTVNELIAMKIPAIFIPLAIATKNEQFKNAKIMESRNCAYIIEENKLSSAVLFEFIDKAFKPDEFKRLKEGFSTLASSQNTTKLRDVLLDTLHITRS